MRDEHYRNPKVARTNTGDTRPLRDEVQNNIQRTQSNRARRLKPTLPRLSILEKTDDTSPEAE